jgi:exodeoxyribonuclease VII small subunit
MTESEDKTKVAEGHAKPVPVKPKDFEDALSQLETLVKELEQGELSLEASLARYEQGVALARFCNDKLEEAEKRIEVLSTNEKGEVRRDSTGAPRSRPLEIDE